MHPSKKELRTFIEGRLKESDQHDRIRAHVRECVLCSEICDEYTLYMQMVESARESMDAADSHQIAEEQFLRSAAGATISLNPMITDNEDRERAYLLAADGDGEFSPPVSNIATLYSNSPEMVLRVMRDADQDHDYLQLVATDSALVSNVLVSIPERSREFVTDSGGRAIITGDPIEDIATLKWQIKLPDATFSLEPLSYDPESVDYREDIVLETEKNDRIKVSFEGKTEGKQITISILELDGKAEFDAVKVTVCQDDTAELQSVAPSDTATFDLISEIKAVKIRLFN